MFRETAFAGPLEKKSKKTPGIEAEGYVIELLETLAQEKKEYAFEKIEQTLKNGFNDTRMHVDAFVFLRGNMPCAIDITGASREKVREKRKRNRIVSFVCRYDEKTKKPISEPMPHFIIDGINIGQWIKWGQRADREGVPILDVIEEEKQLGNIYKFIVGKMWFQSNETLRTGSEGERKKIKPYRDLLMEECKKIFTKKELEVLGIY